MQLTHRERVRLALRHQETDRVPIAMVCAGINPPAYQALRDHLARTMQTSVETFLEPLIDIQRVAPAYIGPPLPAGTDIWGVRRASVSYGSGAYQEIEHYPLASVSNPGDLASFPWPSPDWFDYSSIPDRIRAIQKDGPFCLMVTNGNIFETSWYMRGFERMFMDLVANPELAHGIMSRVCDYHVEFFKRVLSAADGAIDLIFTADDIAGQEGLLMSLDMWSRQIKPLHTRLNRTIHNYGAKVIYHSDGAVMQAVPGLMEMGIDVLQALQFDAKGMDPKILKDEYGATLCFEGGVSVQSTLPFGTVEDVRRETRERIDVLGRNGGYILGPSHAIQAGTPPENVVAMFETAATHQSA